MNEGINGGMRAQRPRRRGSWEYPCGCLMLFSFGLVMAFGLVYAFSPGWPGLLLQLAGTSSIGRTDALFAAATVPPAPMIQNQGAPGQVTVDLGTHGSQTLATTGYRFATGSDETGRRAALATFTEAELMNVCRQYSAVCRDGGERYRDVNIDLRPGGAVVYAEVDLGVVWQRVGIVLQLGMDRTRFESPGVDIAGSVYPLDALPPAAAGASGTVNEIVTLANDVLRQLAVNAAGEDYRLSELIIDDTTLTMVLR